MLTRHQAPPQPDEGTNIVCVQATVQAAGFTGALSVSPHNASAQTATYSLSGQPVLNLTSGATAYTSSYNAVNASVKSYRLCMPQDQPSSSTQGLNRHAHCLHQAARAMG